MMTAENRDSGYVLVTALTLSVLLILMVAVSTNMALTSTRSTATETRKVQAFYVAQSGMERALAQLNILQTTKVPTTVKSNAEAAQWLTVQLSALSGTLPSAGSFSIAGDFKPGAKSTDPAILTLFSTGTAVNGGGTRRITMEFPVVLNTDSRTPGAMTGMAPAALTVTGNSSINGASPIAGETNPTGTIHTMTCPVALRQLGTCQRKPGDPDKYVMKYKNAVPPTFQAGKMLRPTKIAAGQTSEERYLVDRVDPATGEVELSVISDYIAQSSGGFVNRTFSATEDILMQERNDVPALLVPPGTSFSSMSANVRDTCSTYACEHYTMSSDSMFKMIMGGTKTDVEQMFQNANRDVPGTYNTSGTAGCGIGAQWLKLSGTSANLNQCTNPQLIVIDGRGKSSVNVDIPPQKNFRGLLYVLADPGVSVKVAGNVGFAGAMMLDNGNGGIDLNGNAGFNTDCYDEQAEDNLKKTPKLCYDAEILGKVRSGYIDTFFNDGFAVAKTAGSAKSWAEVGQP